MAPKGVQTFYPELYSNCNGCLMWHGGAESVQYSGLHFMAQNLAPNEYCFTQAATDFTTTSGVWTDVPGMTCTITLTRDTETLRVWAVDRKDCPTTSSPLVLAFLFSFSWTFPRMVRPTAESA